MAKRKEDLFFVEITDIIEPEQEDRVIDVVGPYLKKSYDELKKYFETTDTIKIKRISREEAESIADSISGIDITVNIGSIEERKKESEGSVIRCPRCGYILEFPDWRCPECYYEFPDYEFVGDDEFEDEISE